LPQGTGGNAASWRGTYVVYDTGTGTRAVTLPKR